MFCWVYLLLFFIGGGLFLDIGVNGFEGLDFCLGLMFKTRRAF